MLLPGFLLIAILHASLVEGQECPTSSGAGICLQGCDSDADCASTGQLCCSNGCGNVCTDPVYSITCANVLCIQGSTCMETGNGPKCQTTGSGGVCPTPVEGTVSNCAQLCTSDSDCNGNRLCCSNGCGQECTKPVSAITCANVECADGPCVDTGNGPKCQNNGQTGRRKRNAGNKQGCSSDSDCNGNKECCNGVCSPNCSPCDSVTCLAGDETCVETPEPHCECTSSVYNCLVSPCSVTPCDNHPAAECRDSYCGGCHAVWTENGQILNNCQAA